MSERLDRFQRMYDEYYGSVVSYVLRRADTAEDAYDAVSETFLTAWRRLDDLPEGPATLPWLYGTARRMLANSYRGAQRQRRLLTRIETEQSSRIGGENELPDSSELRSIAVAFSRLSVADQEVLVLAASEDLNGVEIAAVVGCKPVTARVRLFRARARFAKALDREGVKRGGASGHQTESRADARHEHEDAL